MQMGEVTVIIPSIRWEVFTQRCVDTCSKLYPSVELVLVLDDVDVVPGGLPFLVVEQLGGTISSKRNRGVALARSEFIAFIDSDAFPHRDWLPATIEALRERPDASIVGGPNISPPEQDEGRTLVGMATRSWLVAGRWSFYKSAQSAPRYCDNLPACNMVMRKADYMAIGGMEASLELGEDTDLCARVIASGRKVYFEPKAIVYHYDRNITDYLRQRMVRGAGLYMLLAGGSAQRRNPYTYLMLQPVLTLLLVASFPLALFWDGWAMLLLLGASSYMGLVLFEAARHADRFLQIPALSVLIIVGNLLPGVGFIAKATGLLPSLNSFYRNDRA
jgi:cellulose synthase/poly-beta-1,6-N-acetylglucosamine synthase-like glycosyltransferase